MRDKSGESLLDMTKKKKKGIEMEGRKIEEGSAAKPLSELEVAVLLLSVELAGFCPWSRRVLA